VFQAWDFSITEKETSDWIVGATMLQDEFDNVYEMDLMRFRVDEDAHALVDAILDFHEKWDPFMVGFEDGQIFKSMKSLLVRRAQERRIPLMYETLTPLTDKLVRAGPLRGRMQMGKLFFAQDSPHRATVDNELLRFPGGKHDDIVDAYAWCMRMILAHAPVAEKHVRHERKLREKTLAQKLKEFMNGRGSHMAA
jgi:predicted phage terminase large subunit-like protein